MADPGKTLASQGLSPHQGSQTSWSLCLAGMLLAPAGDMPLPHVEPVSARTSAAPGSHRPTLNEMEITSRARRALLAEPKLKGVNLFVQVKDGTGSLSGPVPSRELGELAETILQGVRGIYQVSNQLYVQAPEPEKPFVLPLQPEPPQQTQSAFAEQKPAARGTLAGRTPEAGLPTGPNTGTVPFPDAPPPQAPQPGVILLPPVAIKDPVPPVSPEPVPANPAPPAAVTTRGADLAQLRQTIEQLRRGDRQFRPLRVEVRDGASVWVFDDPWHGEAVTAFAQALRRLPGVREVLIKNPTAGSP